VVRSDPPISVMCVSTTAALCHFISRGLDPGRFGRALLKRDRAIANRSAHAALRKNGGVDSMLAFVDAHLPAALFDSDEAIDRWIGHHGFQGASDTEKLMLLFISPHRWWDRLVPLEAP
jgi:hypothetical protein